MSEKIEMATVSSRGQICIPNSIREEMDIKEGSKVIFALIGDSVIMKKISMQTFEEVTKPLREAAAKAGLREEDVPEMIHRFRKKKREKK